MALVGAVCTTAAAGRVGAADAPERPETTDGGPEQPGVVVTASSPTNVRFRADAGDIVVPLTPVRPPPSARHHSAALNGLWIGVLGGVLLGVQRDRDARGKLDADCCGSAVIPGALLVGLIGLGVGALVGAFGSDS